MGRWVDVVRAAKPGGDCGGAARQQRSWHGNAPLAPQDERVALLCVAHPPPLHIPPPPLPLTQQLPQAAWSLTGESAGVPRQMTSAGIMCEGVDTACTRLSGCCAASRRLEGLQGVVGRAWGV